MPKYDPPRTRAFEPLSPAVGEYIVNSSTITGTLSTTAGLMRMVPFWLTKRTRFDRIAAEVTTLAAGSTVRLGVYKADAHGRPDARMLDAGTIDGESATVQEITIDLTLAPGLYFMAVVAQGGTPTLRGANPPHGWHQQVQSAAALGGAIGGWSIASITGALPASVAGSISNSGAGYRCAMRVAAF